MRKKIRKFIVSLCVTFAALYLLLWVTLNYILIPRVVIPKAREFLSSHSTGPLKLTIKNIYFDPFRGFLLRDVKALVASDEGNKYILSAKYADLDINFIALLWKRIEINNFALKGLHLNIVRDEQGSWNFSALFSSGLGKEEKVSGKMSLLIKKFSLKDGTVDYMDRFKAANNLQRRFSNVDIVLLRQSEAVYKIAISAGTKGRSDESIEADISWDKQEESLGGTIKINTRYLNSYWDYYLDEWLRPWHVRAQNVSLWAGFDYSDKTLNVDGGYTITGGIFTFGDLVIKAEADAQHKQKFVKGDPAADTVEVNISLKDMVILTGKHAFLSEGESSLLITENKVDIHKLTGLLKGKPLNLSGRYTFIQPKQLTFQGRLSGMNTDLLLQILPDNHGVLDWHGSARNSDIKLHANIQDMISHVFDATLEGNIRLEDLTVLLRTDKTKIRGGLNISGLLSGELDKADSLQANLKVGVTDFSALGLKPLSFDCDLKSGNGVLSADIPETPYYQGSVSGLIQLDYDRWGAQLNLNNLDVHELLADIPKFKDIRGRFTGNVSVVSEWGDIDSMQGGGYLKLTGSQLHTAPVVSEAEEGISTIIKSFVMPVFKEVEGNFRIQERKIYVDNLICHAPTLDLGISGNYSFSGDADFTCAATVLGGGIVKLAKHIIFPFTISIDLLTSSIQVRITGRFPDFKNTTQIQPMAWLKDFFKFLSSIDPKKYTLEKIW